MPVRSFKVHCFNQSSFLTLRQSFNHLCGGAWTDGWGSPPSTIAPGTDVGFQSESDGVLTGTEGYIKFDVVDNGGNRHGMVYIYWDNPYYGVTSFKVEPALSDVEPDCDFQKSSDGSSFADPSTLDFTAGYMYSQDGIDPGLSGNALNAALSFISAPFEIFAAAGIAPHALLSVYLQDHEQPGFYGTSTTSYQVVATPEVKDWTGHWSSQGVDIQIAPKTGTTISITIADPASSLTMSQDVDVNLGLMQYVGKTSAVNLGGETLAANPKGVSAVQAAVSKSLSDTSLITKPQAEISAQVHNTLANDVNVKQAQVSSTVLQNISGNVAKLAARSRSTLRLDNGVALTLMQASNNGSPSGTTIHYQRSVASPPVNRDVEVGHYQPPPR